jgi:protein-tyrosine-phosphatase/peptidoglycan/xylan/chitin deacetylase (PgdA/CDA1 family)
LTPMLGRVLPINVRAAWRELRALPASARLMWLRYAIGRRRRFERSLRRAALLPAEPHILFVCYGNLYRSPMAAVLMEQLARAHGDGGIRVSSAGLDSRDGWPAPGDALAIAREFGVGLDSHRTAILLADRVASADLIVVMDRRDESLVRDRFPGVSSRLLFLGSLDPLPSENGYRIPDPLGGSEHAVRTVYARIVRCVSRLYDVVSHGRKLGPDLNPLKRAVRRAVVVKALAPIWLRFVDEAAAILMLHRFEDRDHGISGHSPDLLAAHLEYLRANDYHLADLEEVVTRLVCGEPPRPRTVVMTVDDGYADFARIGAPVFERYDCPTTVFLTTGFVDGACWMWYDAVRYLLGTETVGEVRFAIDDSEFRLTWNSASDRYRKTWNLMEHLKSLPTHVVERTVQTLATARGISLPSQPPNRFAAMTWADVRRLGGRGIRFGAHTRTHPILSRSDDDRARREIFESWARVRSMTPHTSSVFAYPNGMPSDFGSRERETVLAAGLTAGVASHGGHCTRLNARIDRFALPRLAYYDDLIDVRQALLGIERVKRMLRTRSAA